MVPFNQNNEYHKSQNTASSSDAPTNSKTTTSKHTEIANNTIHNKPADLGTCRICRKHVKADEEFHYCDNCKKIICEDCSSYSSKIEVKVS